MRQQKQTFRIEFNASPDRVADLIRLLDAAEQPGLSGVYASNDFHLSAVVRRSPEGLHGLCAKLVAAGAKGVTAIASMV